MRLFLRPGDTILDFPPSFGVYAFDAAISGAGVCAVPRGDGFRLDVAAVEEAAKRYRPKLLFVASPNNPDGSWLSDADLERLLALPLVVVLDEAYIELAAPAASRIQWVAERENLIVLRSFSKWAGLAGLRLGYGGFPRALMPHFWKIKQPYNVSVAASAAGLAALKDRDHLEQTVARIQAERERLRQALDAIPYLSPYPSTANFLLCRVADRDARELKHALEDEGILVRYFDKPYLRDHIRISVGRPDQSRALLEALGRL
jgi:histidinol-phosphate aminotransferase